MGLLTVLSGLTFLQLMIFTLTILVTVVGLVFLITQRGISTKFFSIGGRKGTNGTAMIFLLEALKIKDDIYRIDRLTFLQQKKYARNKMEIAKDMQLRAFGEILRNQDGDIPDLTKHRDYLYYNLLVERMYREIFSHLMDSFEKNGLSRKPEFSHYSKERAEAIWQYGLNVAYSFYNGIMEVNREVHDRKMKEVSEKVIDTIVVVYNYAIQSSKKAKDKKDALRTELIEKTDKIDFISSEQLKTLFSDIVAEDFLDS